MLGFASTVMCSWEVLLVLFKLSLYTGGFPNLVRFPISNCTKLESRGLRLSVLGLHRERLRHAVRLCECIARHPSEAGPS